MTSLTQRWGYQEWALPSQTHSEQAATGSGNDNSATGDCRSTDTFYAVSKYWVELLPAVNWKVDLVPTIPELQGKHLQRARSYFVLLPSSAFITRERKKYRSTGEILPIIFKVL